MDDSKEPHHLKITMEIIHTLKYKAFLQFLTRYHLFSESSVGSTQPLIVIVPRSTNVIAYALRKSDCDCTPSDA